MTKSNIHTVTTIRVHNQLSLLNPVLINACVKCKGLCSKINFMIQCVVSKLGYHSESGVTHKQQNIFITMFQYVAHNTVGDCCVTVFCMYVCIMGGNFTLSKNYFIISLSKII